MMPLVSMLEPPAFLDVLVEGRHTELERYRVIQLQSTADRETPTQPLQRVRKNVGITRVLTGKVSPGQSIWVCPKRTPDPLQSSPGTTLKT